MKTLLCGLWSVLFVGVALPAFASDAPGCTNPAWAPQHPAGYDISECSTRAWAKLDVDTTSGSKTVYGRLTTVTYQLHDGAKDHTADDVRNFYAAIAMKSGAKPMTDPKSGYGVTLEKKTPQADEWIVYTHGSGNETSTGSYTLTTLDIAPLTQEAVAQPMAGPLNVKSKPCVAPPWLKTGLAGYKVNSCEGKAWDSVSLSLKGGDKTVEGAHLSVTYNAISDKNEFTAIAVEKNFVNALQAIGAKLMSNADDVNHAVLTQQTKAAEVWYIYEHGNGNDDATGSFTLETLVVTPFTQEVVAQALNAPLSGGKICADPAWLKKQFSYFKLSDCSYRDVDQVVLDLPGGKKTLAGRYVMANYTLTDPTRDPTALNVKKNYVNALQAIGAKLVSDPNDVYHAVLTQKTPLGDLWYVYEHGSGNDTSTGSYSLMTVEVGGPPPKTCTLEVYGVNFDFNKATLRPESEPVLQQVLALFTADPGYSAEVGGHTDNIGKAAYNLKLSAARADAVKVWLVAHGVAASRLTTQGYGDTRPLVPNTTDANRFKNRRVELKRNNCHG